MVPKGEIQRFGNLRKCFKTVFELQFSANIRTCSETIAKLVDVIGTVVL